jgi:hypothetical protein
VDLYIKFIAIVNTETGEIENISTVPGGQIPEEGFIVGTNPAKERFHLLTEDWGGYDILQIQEQFYRANNAWVSRGPKPTKYHKWNLSNTSWEQNWNSFLVDIRKERNKRLAASDWTQFADNPLGESVKASWRNYRNLLRDIPSVYAESSPSISSLEHIEWPEPPDGSILEVTPLP